MTSLHGPILLAGCGDLGVGLGARLAEDGVEVWGLRRQVQSLPSFLQGWAADLTQPETLIHPPASFTTVVYTATPERGSGGSGYQAAYVEGVRHLLEALPSIQRFVLVSSTSVYVQTQGEEVTEDSPTRPSHKTGQAILEGERLVFELGKAACVVRFGGIYGPRRTGLMEQVLQGQAVCYDGAVRYTNRIHRDDCVRMLHHILYLPQPAPIYIGVDSGPAPRNEVLRWLAKQLHVAPPVTRPASEAPESRRQRSNKRCQNHRIVKTGFVFQYPTYKDGYRAIIAAQKEEEEDT